MKKLKVVLMIFLTLTLTFSLFSCFGCKHADGDKDGICDKCEEKIILTPKDVTLIDKAGNPLFQIVLGDDVDPSSSLAVKEFVLALEEIDIEVEIVDDEEETIADCEILVGTVKTRGKIFEIPGRSLGNDGYVVKIVENKILINGGSADALKKAFKTFVEDIIEFEGDEFWDVVTMTPDEQIDESQSEYDITSLSVAGEDMEGYVIAANPTNATHLNGAKTLQDTIYKRTGYWFEVVDLKNAPEKAIVISEIPKVYGDESFKISVDGKTLKIDCAFENKFLDALSAFITANFVQKEGDINFEGTIFKRDISFVTYADFGATDNGKKDNDFAAIYEAHQFANECGQRIIVEGKPTYYIGLPTYKGSAVTIKIKTDTNWGNATIYIDDTTIKLHDASHKKYIIHVFEVLPSIDNDTAPKESHANLTLTTETDKIDLGYNREMLIKPVYSGHRVYRRKNYDGGHQGGALSEVIYLKADGTVSEETKLMWNYPGIDYISVHYIDTETLTIEGGTIRTIANSEHMVYTDPVTKEKTVRDAYFSRGLSIERSNTIVRGVKHYVEGEITLKEQVEEGKLGVAYSGFFVGNFANHITIKDCVLSGRRCFTKTVEAGNDGTTGTYDFSAAYVNMIVLENCTQHNFWVQVNDNGEAVPVEEGTFGAQVSMARCPKFGKGVYAGASWAEQGPLMHWGVGGTNYCKNMQYINSTLSRFDAHCGLMNGKVIGSTVNILALTGMGDFEIRDSRIFSLDPSATYNTILHLRSDYGSVWNGDISIKNFKAFLYKDAPYVVMSTYTNWYFGYECAFPSIEMDNVSYYDVEEYYKTATVVPFNEGDRVYLYTGKHITLEPRLHLETIARNNKDTKLDTPPTYTYIDLDKDGYVDGYLDKDGKKMVYVDADKDVYKSGIIANHSYVNLNPIKPPKYIKVFNNNGQDTDGDGVGDTGGIILSLDRTDNLGVEGGGFFGETKFYYAPDKYYTGTPAENAAEDTVFRFN